MKKWFFCLFFISILWADVDYLNMGIVAHQKGFYSLSNQQIEKYIKQNPDGKYLDYAYLLYANNCIKLGKIEESREKLLFLIKNFPESKYLKTSYIYIILVEIKLSNTESALKFYNSYVKKWGRNPEIEKQLSGRIIKDGIDAFKKGEYHRSENLFNRVIENFKESEFLDIANYYKGLIYYQKDEFLKAKKFFLRVKGENIEILPDLYLKIGDCFLNLKDYQNAKKYYSQIIEKWPQTETSNWALMQMAMINKREGKLTEAEQTLKKIKTTNKKLRCDSLKALSEIYILQEQWKKAEDVILNIFKEFPDEKTPDNYIKLGFINFNMKNMEQAISYFKKAISLNPSKKLREKVYFGLGYTYYLSKNIKEGFYYWDKIEKEFPASNFLPEIYFIKGKKYFEMGKISESQKYLEKLLRNYKKSPFLTQTLALLIQSYIEQGNLTQAEKISEEFKNRDPEIEFFYGKVLYIKKEYDKARKVFENLKTKNPFLKVEITYYLAEIYLLKGEKEKAKEKFLEIITYYPQFKEYSKLAEKRLKELEK